MSNGPPTVLVIGAGAAGLMAAIFAATRGARVRVLERSRDGGRKILISGGGRCNVLPSVLAPERFVTDSSPALLRRLLQAWPLDGQRAFFEHDLGIALALEPETGKLFPVSNRARDVRDGLIRRARSLGVEFSFDASVIGLRRNAAAWVAETVEGADYGAQRVVIATGGLSIPATGSDGTGLRLAEAMGHQLTPTYPALTPLLADPAVHAGLAGISLTITLAGRQGGKRVSSRGGFLFTHRGYSGPAVLDLSHLAVRARLAQVKAPLAAQWCALGAAEWEAELVPRGTRTVGTALREQLPARLVDQLLSEIGIDADRQLSQLKRDERRLLILRLTRYELPWTGDEGYRKAEVTGGGVKLGEVVAGTLESRRHPGLYLCGEILDAFGPIGGHNFAWAWATGRAAGIAAGAG